MSVLRPFYLILSCFAFYAVAQEPATVKKVQPHPTAAIGGKQLFAEYCAACHGVAGKGDGPAAASLKQRPNDLTQMSHANGGRFPEEKFLSMMNGQTATAAHGSNDMPIWGSAFRNTAGNQNLAQDRIHSLMSYLEDLQAK